jgi:hypothetical protein
MVQLLLLRLWQHNASTIKENSGTSMIFCSRTKDLQTLAGLAQTISKSLLPKSLESIRILLLQECLPGAPCPFQLEKLQNSSVIGHNLKADLSLLLLLILPLKQTYTVWGIFEIETHVYKPHVFLGDSKSCHHKLVR